MMEKNVIDKIFIVKYCGGSYDDYYTATVFATTKKSTATKYVTKFNKILKKWSKYYERYEDKRGGFNWIKEEFIDHYFDRWYKLQNITKCYYEEVSVR